MRTQIPAATGWTAASRQLSQLGPGRVADRSIDLWLSPDSQHSLSISSPTSIPGIQTASSIQPLDLLSLPSASPAEFDMISGSPWHALNPSLMSTTSLHDTVESSFSGARASLNGGSGWLRNILNKGAYWMVLGGATAATSLGVHLEYDPTVVLATVSVASFFTVWALENIYPNRDIPSVTNKEYGLSILHNIFSAGIFPEVGKHALTIGAAYFLAHEFFTPIRDSNILDNLSLEGLPFIMQIAIGLTVADFGWYWLHRFLHVNKSFWKLHEVHHLSESMTTLASGVNHPVNLLLSYFILIGTLKMLGIDESATAIIMGGIVAPNDFLKHSNAKLDIGDTARLVLNDNKLHGFHHSADPEEYDVNFGNTLTFWDQMFGTFYNPKDKSGVELVGVERRYFDKNKSALGNFIEHTWYPIRDIAQGFLNSAKKFIGL